MEYHSRVSCARYAAAVKPLHFTKSSFGRNDLASPRALRRTDDFPKTQNLNGPRESAVATDANLHTI